MLIPVGPFTRLKAILLPEARGPIETDLRVGPAGGLLPGSSDLHTIREGDNTLRLFCLDFDALDDPEAVLA